MIFRARGSPVLHHRPKHTVDNAKETLISNPKTRSKQWRKRWSISELSIVKHFFLQISYIFTPGASSQLVPVCVALLALSLAHENGEHLRLTWTVRAPEMTEKRSSAPIDHVPS